MVSIFLWSPSENNKEIPINTCQAPLILTSFKTKPSDIEMIDLLDQEAPESQVVHLENTCWGVIVGANSTQATTSCFGT